MHGANDDGEIRLAVLIDHVLGTATHRIAFVEKLKCEETRQTY
jgi:hypothetical protein